MANPFADDLFEIYGTHIALSSIQDYRLGQIEFIMRPVYGTRNVSKWHKALLGRLESEVTFWRMEPYAAIIGEHQYKNAIDETRPANMAEAVIKDTFSRITNAIARNQSVKDVRYRLMNSAWRVFERRMDEIPAVLIRADGKRSEVYSVDELHGLIGEPLAPTKEMQRALFINTTDGNYVFFGNGIQVSDIEQEYERLKMAIAAMKEIQARQKAEGGLLQGIQGLFSGVRFPSVNIPFLSSDSARKAMEERQISQQVEENQEHTDDNL